MARPMTETTKNIVAVLEKNKDITYNEAVDQGLIDPNVIPVARFNVTKHNFTHGKIVALSGAPKPKVVTRKVSVPKVKTAVAPKTPGRPRTLVAVPAVGDLTASMKIVADAGGLAKAKVVIAQADTLRAAVTAVELAQASLAKIA